MGLEKTTFRLYYTYQSCDQVEDITNYHVLSRSNVSVTFWTHTRYRAWDNEKVQDPFTSCINRVCKNRSIKEKLIEYWMILQTFPFEYLRAMDICHVTIGLCCGSILESMGWKYNDKLFLKFRIVNTAMVEIMSWLKTQRSLIVILKWQSKR